MELYFKGEGLDIFSDGNKYFLRYDTGDHIGTIETTEITQNEAEIIEANQIQANKIILKYQNIAMGLTKE